MVHEKRRSELSIFEKMSALAVRHQAINLGQGKPETPDPQEVIDLACEALRDCRNQYVPVAGVLALREALAHWYRETQGLALHPEQFAITTGATEALAATISVFVEPQDEVIVFEPAYDAYAPMVRNCGGVPVTVPLTPPHWRYDLERLAATITPKTRAMIINTPHNPSGSAATPSEMAAIGRICASAGISIIADEVWEAVRFDGESHASVLSIPDVSKNCIKIGSAGKIYGLTGWRIGWICGPRELVARIVSRHQWLTFCAPAPFQFALARALGEQEIANRLRDDWFANRQRLVAGLRKIGFAVYCGPATWFVSIDLERSGIALTDWDFSMRCVAEAGVASIPISEFYEAGGGFDRHVRLSFCLPQTKIDQALERLAHFRSSLAG